MKRITAPALALLVMLAACASPSDGSAPGVDVAAIETTVADAVIEVVVKALPSIIDALIGERLAP